VAAMVPRCGKEGLKPLDYPYVVKGLAYRGCQRTGGGFPVLLLTRESDILATIHGPYWTAGGIMEWTAPAFEEVCLNCEINSYASATL